MNKFTKSFIQILSIAVFPCIVFFSCQKADPAPYSNPTINVPVTIIPPTFTAEVNNSLSITSFTPIKTFQGSYIILKGVSTYYTITLTFPSSTGPGNYTIGSTFYPDFTATLVNGSTTYVVNSTYGLGSLRINSISADDKYSGTFNFTAQDTITHSNINVNQGSFSNM